MVKALNNVPQAQNFDNGQVLNRSVRLSSTADVQEYKWIATERRHFGVSGSQYDWNATSPKKKLAEMREAQSTVQQLDKKVNKAVRWEGNMLDSAPIAVVEVCQNTALALAC